MKEDYNSSVMTLIRLDSIVPGIVDVLRCADLEESDEERIIL